MTRTSISSERTGNTGRLPYVNKKKVLVVDDDLVVIWALSTKLKANGFEVFTARDGAEAVRIVRTQRPDVILLDINFPVDVNSVSWDGFLIMDWLKRLAEADNVPIIVITSGNSEKFRNRAKEAGAAAFFHKPIDHDQLFAYIRRKLGMRRTAPSRSYPSPT